MWNLARRLQGSQDNTSSQGWPHLVVSDVLHHSGVDCASCKWGHGCSNSLYDWYHEMKERGEDSHITRACTMQKVSIRTFSVDCLDWFPGGRAKTKEVWRKDNERPFPPNISCKTMLVESQPLGKAWTLCSSWQAVTHKMWLSRSKDTWATCWRMAERTRWEHVAFGTTVGVMCSSIMEAPPPFSTSKLLTSKFPNGIGKTETIFTSCWDLLQEGVHADWAGYASLSSMVEAMQNWKPDFGITDVESLKRFLQATMTWYTFHSIASKDE